MREETILRKLKTGDPSALEAVMDGYISYVSAVVWNILRYASSAEDAEEVVSDVFLAAWDQAQQIQPGCLKAWLGAVARHKAKSKLRQAGKELPLEEDILELPDENTPDAIVQRAEEQRLVRKAVAQMEPPDREIFLRHYYYAQTVEEIAREMDMKEGTIKTKLRRGRMRLKTILQRWGVV